MSGRLDELRAQMRDFIDGRVIPAESVLDEDTPEAAAKLERLKSEAKDRGLWALGHPEEIGGGGLDLASFVLLNEIIGRSEYGQLAVGSVTMQDAIMLHTHGTPEQRERYLLPMVAGEAYPAVALTEPEVAGSDPTLIRAEARLDGEEWVINGHKWFTTGADRAAYVSVFCRTEPDDVPRHLAFSAIIVPAGTPGLEIVRRVPTMGHTRGAHCELRLEDVRVPRESLLGERGKAFVIAQERLGPGRLFHAMRWLGQAQRAFELMLARLGGTDRVLERVYLEIGQREARLGALERRLVRPRIDHEEQRSLGHMLVVVNRQFDDRPAHVRRDTDHVGSHVSVVGARVYVVQTQHIEADHDRADDD